MSGPGQRLFDEGEVAAATGATPIHSGSSTVAGVAVDSRKVLPGSAFFALPGERTDGHRFLGAAAQAGAVLLVVSADQAQARSAEIAELARRFHLSVLISRDTLAALQDLARFHLGRLPAMTRVAVTGSNGKTTTKELIASILRQVAPTTANEGNLNSEIGLPLACFEIAPTSRYTVFEMGINHPGEMETLADIVRPDVALITNIGVAHIGLLGSQEGIAREKRRIFSKFDGRQIAVLPEAAPFKALLAEGVRGRIVYHGPSSTPGYEGSEPMGLDGTIIRWEGLRVRFPLFGPHNLSNALAAISLSREMGIAVPAIRDGLEAARPLFGRSQVLTGRLTLLADCYNANPDSMGSALDFVEAVPWQGRKVAVLGAMRELGDQTVDAHRALGARLRATSCGLVFLLGPEMEEAWKAMEGSPAAGRSRWFSELEPLAGVLQSALHAGDLVLLKGSRSLEMEQLLPSITGESAPAGHGAPGRVSTC
ncbi:MAG TPA: UDP-N-acetylmuramoyl-tripeptide--D-alanyl-D-alanine ligase [Spirochaetia bacterium]|nr:UDP-N-acetylmuramoyl-tripeptide--D-alanyl-D-alanine ligase [Spirochaetia bacterium]